MPTARGWALAALGVALAIASRAFGAESLGQIGFALVVLALVAVLVVRLGRHDLVVSRSVAPEQIAAGMRVEVKLTLSNTGSGAAPLVLLEDHIPAPLRTRARVAFAGVEPRGAREARYELRPGRRGRYRLGPVDMSYVDPFSLARVRRAAGTSSMLLVHPRIEPLVLPRDLGERRSLSVSALRQPTGATGEDFYTLREYIEGDDLRKIHWPSTAKRRRFMIRQEETPWHNRATIVLDDRGIAFHPDAFERAVEAAASLVDLYHRAGYSYRLAGAHHPGLPSARGAQHRNRCLDHLATVTTKKLGSGPDPLLVARCVELENRQAAEGTLVVVTGDLDPEAATAVSRCRRRFKQVIAVMFPTHLASVDAVRLLTRSGVRGIVLGPGEPLASGWGSLSRGVGGGEGAWDLKHEPA